MKKSLLFLFILCSLTISAQNAASRKTNTKRIVPKKQTTTARTRQQTKPSATRTITAKYSDGVLTVNGVSYSMVYVQGGTFLMGATPEQGSDALVNEKPAHKVTLDSFCIGKTEVTQALWKAVMGSNPSKNKGDRKPVENVTWNDCQTFISKLNSLTGKNFRLPTEAEWEFAARGGTKSKGYKYSGSNNLDIVGWYDEIAGVTTHETAKKQANELGIYDMSGNVCEWCSDWGDGAYTDSEETNPTGPDSGWGHIFRGGSCGSRPWGCRTTYRYDLAPDYSDEFHGLRLALSE